MNKKVLVVVVLVLLLGLVYVKRRGIMRILSGGQTQTSVSVPSQPNNITPVVTEGTNNIYMTKTDAKLGSYFVDPKGMTLYTYTKDQANVSNCTGKCLTNWPAYTTSNPLSTLPSNWGTMKRSDGTIQYTYKNMPLYYYIGDKAPGDVNGQGVGGVWFVAK